MIKNVAIVSLSSGIIGENFVKHELEIGVKRLKNFGLNVIFMPNALKGIEYIKNHPQDRAKDLLQAFSDPNIDMILCAIGGDDTYSLLPYLFENDELKNVINNKVFLGFSDTTINHFMLNKLGLKTFYGQSFLADICELDNEMLPYTKKYFEELINNKTIKMITPSDVWYEERKCFNQEQIGVPRKSHKNLGFELIQGKTIFKGRILGGCIESIYDMFNGERYADMPILCQKYNIFPKKEEWQNKILLLESSEEKVSPELYRKALISIKEQGVFDVVSGIIVGKPMDETYYEDYKKELIDIVDNPDLSIVYNINIGHATPRCIIPFGIDAIVNVEKQMITFNN